MLPPTQHQIYNTFQKLIQILKDYLIQGHTDTTHLETQFVAIQTQFQQHMLPLAQTEDGLDWQHRLQSIQVEITKQLKLLSLDVMFLRAAKQEVTVKQRQRQMVDRLQLLLAYCEAILNL